MLHKELLSLRNWSANRLIKHLDFLLGQSCSYHMKERANIYYKPNINQNLLSPNKSKELKHRLIYI